MSDKSTAVVSTPAAVSRRHWLQATASGFGYLAFAALAHEQAMRNQVQAAVDNPLAPKAPHFPPRARRVIFLCMEGGPSHVDTFDYKPRLKTDDGKAPPRSGTAPFRFGRLMASPFQFRQHGQSGLWISELFPHLARHADKLCLLNGMQTDLPNHPQAFLQMHCGIFQFPRPSMGAWILYGLGTENQNLPGFITINPPLSNGGPANYGAAFLPAMYQGTRIGRGFGGFGGANGPAAVANLKNPRQSLAAQRVQLDLLQDLNRQMIEHGSDQAAIEGLIASYELAFRMQGELPRLLDLSNEPASTLRLYGLDSRGMGAGAGPAGMPGGAARTAFAQQCLLARRFAEAGVRFVEVTLGGWDHHRNLKEALAASCAAIDQPIAALLQDLEQRGLLRDTLVLWGGEFGRTPTAQGDGRDHNARGFTMWLAGGGVKGGYRYGRTDDHGFEAVEGKVHIHDWHATILHLLGLDHEKLTFRHAGRDMRLTDVKGRVVQEILA
ncbi:MAG: DUF1501 domain-containing protein [Gemmataceae bacterium]|nr:DUF1501 domain-containing protein [Gemmataceae bacterium]MDW8241674.1 DUF1501 domain-containing protein [Thermogemmata sp.]